ncbi:MAG TPA: GatB/YqeY domain-containing protein [Patescibacteria group bacterium]|nr:GatB/YqeY domain-containing protein [Patescibacteria group bacterium]
MISLALIDSDLTAAMKAKDQLITDTLRGLKTRAQNEKIAKQHELTETELVSLVKSEVKRRKDAAAAYTGGGRPELADKELKEAAALEKYLPAQLSEAELAGLIDRLLQGQSWTAKDFGAAMGKLKGQVGDKADGALLARMLKEKLK